MNTRFHYILIGIIAASVYLIYLIGYYTIQQFQTNAFMDNIEQANKKITSTNKEKEFLASYIRTSAYQTQVAKAMHNKKLPGEEVINIIKPDELAGNQERDPAAVIAQAKADRNDPTKNMSNPQKWLYLIQHGMQPKIQ